MYISYVEKCSQIVGNFRHIFLLKFILSSLHHQSKVTYIPVYFLPFLYLTCICAIFTFCCL